MIKALATFGEKLNSENVIWGVGGSVMLSFYGLADKPKDIDIVVSLDSIKNAIEILDEIGERKEVKKNSDFSTRHFYKYRVDGADLDVMSGFMLNTKRGIFEYHFDEFSIAERKEVEGVSIPLCALEDWFVLYNLMPGRLERVKAIEEYLIKNGINNMGFLHKAIDGDIPINIIERIKTLIDPIEHNNIYI